jgi:tRNA/tmRNA/rRNA uracil-C5-methylase (TrmA/RlmC/RlmD family)
MRRIVYLIGIIGLICLACNKKSKDNQVLPINSMKLIMWDMMKADEWFVQTTIKDTQHLRKKENIELYEQVFAIHNTSRKQFYNTYKFYQTHPDQLKILIDSITAFSNREKTLIDSMHKARPVK